MKVSRPAGLDTTSRFVLGLSAVEVSYVILSFGGGDTANPAVLAIPAEVGFDTGLEALKQLSADLWVIYVAQRGTRAAPCCQEAIETDATYHYCPRCGTALGDANIEGFHSWCESLLYNNAALKALGETEMWGSVWSHLEELGQTDPSEVLALTIAEDWLCAALPDTVATPDQKDPYQYEDWTHEVELERFDGGRDA